MPQESRWHCSSQPDTTTSLPSSARAFSTTSHTVNGRSVGPAAQAVSVRMTNGSRRITARSLRSHASRRYVRFPPIADIRISVDAVAMRRLWILAYGAAVASIALLMGREVVDAGLYVLQALPSRRASMAAAGWLISTFGPLGLSIGVLVTAQRLQPQWVLHVLFSPCAFALDRAGASILFYAADVPDGDGIEGRTLIAAFGFLVLTLLVHVTARAALAVGRISRRASVR